MDIAKHLAGIFEIGGATIFLLLLICGTAAWKIKDYMVNTGLLVLVFPLVMFLSMAVYYTFTVQELYATKKMAEWLMWTVAAGTLGTMLGVAMLVSLSRLWERQEAG